TNSKQIISKYQTNFLIRIRKIILEYNQESIKLQHSKLNRGLYVFVDVLIDHLFNSPNKLKIKYHYSDLKINKDDSFNLKWYKRISKIRMFFTQKNNEIKYNIQYSDLIQEYLPTDIYLLLNQKFKKFGEYQLKLSVDIQNAINHLYLDLWELENNTENNKLQIENISKIEEKIIKELNNVIKTHYKSYRSLRQLLVNDVAIIVNKISAKFDILQINKEIKRTPKRVEKRQRIEILNIPNKWFNNQKLISNSTYIEIMLLSFEYRVRNIFDEVIVEVENVYDEMLINKLNKFKTFLNNYQEDVEYDILPEFNISSKEFNTVQNSFQIREKFEASVRKLKYAIRKFPEKISVMSENSYNNYLIEQFDGVEVLNVSASRLLDYILQNELIEPIQKVINYVPENIEIIQSNSRDIIRFIDFNLRQKGAPLYSEKDAATTDLSELFQEQIIKIENLLEIADKQKNEVSQNIGSQLNAIFNQLSRSSFTKSGVNIRQYIKNQTSLKKKSEPLSRKLGFINKLKKQIEKLMYRQSKGVLVSKSISKSISDDTRINTILNIVEQVSFNKKLINKLPVYYQQLFLRKQHYYNEFWFGREKGLKDAGIAIERYNSGFSGGLLILGEYGSGKTFYSHYISSRFFNSQNTYIVNPPFSGSINPD
ncbi:MAG: hypothetical protein U9R54_07770, partial [Bacteroidota bacterium]|nr:hypothetical protein [Bacteroidota bacterium]